MKAVCLALLAFSATAAPLHSDSPLAELYSARHQDDQPRQRTRVTRFRLERPLRMIGEVGVFGDAPGEYPRNAYFPARVRANEIRYPVFARTPACRVFGMGVFKVDAKIPGGTQFDLSSVSETGDGVRFTLADRPTMIFDYSVTMVSVECALSPSDSIASLERALQGLFKVVR